MGKGTGSRGRGRGRRKKGSGQKQSPKYVGKGNKRGRNSKKQRKNYDETLLEKNKNHVL